MTINLYFQIIMYGVDKLFNIFKIVINDGLLIKVVRLKIFQKSTFSIINFSTIMTDEKCGNVLWMY
jgi:hypothetical protein